MKDDIEDDIEDDIASVQFNLTHIASKLLTCKNSAGSGGGRVTRHLTHLWFYLFEK